MWTKILKVAIFIVGVLLVIVGQKNIGATGLLTQFVGLGLLLTLLYLYNRKYK